MAIIIQLSVPCLLSGSLLPPGTLLGLPNKIAAELIHNKIATPVSGPRCNQTFQPSEKRND